MIKLPQEEKEADEVNFSYDSNVSCRRVKRVRLRSNSPSPRYSHGSSEKSVSDANELYRSFSESNVNYNADPNVYLATTSIETLRKTNSTAQQVIRQYSIIGKEELLELAKRKVSLESSQQQSHRPCNKIDEDEITIVDLTRSNCFELSNDGSDDGNTGKSKHRRFSKQEGWESKIFKNYGIKQVSVDLSNSFNDDETGMSSAQIQ